MRNIKIKDFPNMYSETTYSLFFGIPYAHHYKPRFVHFLPHFSLRIVIKSG